MTRVSPAPSRRSVSLFSLGTCAQCAYFRQPPSRRSFRHFTGDKVRQDYCCELWTLRRGGA